MFIFIYHKNQNKYLIGKYAIYLVDINLIYNQSNF